MQVRHAGGNAGGEFEERFVPSQGARAGPLEEAAEGALGHPLEDQRHQVLSAG